MRKRIARALIKLAHRIHPHADHAHGTHEPSEATLRGGYTMADFEAMRADWSRGSGYQLTSFTLDPEAIAEQRSADVRADEMRAHAKRVIR